MSEREQLLKICEYNVENLFISMEYYEGQDLRAASEDQWRGFALAQLRRKQKPLAKVFGVAQAIQDIGPDIAMLTEVGGKDSLDNFNRHFLDDKYQAFFIEGNSDRNIELAFLVKKNLKFRVEGKSNRDLPVEVHTYQGKYETKFSRDVAELRVYDGERVVLILLLVHLKSMLSTEQDFKGKDVRTAEAIALAEFYKKHRATYPQVPIIVGGDFNTSLSSLELELIQRTDLTDFHDVLKTPSEDRISLMHFEVDGTPRPNVLDYLLVSPHLLGRIDPTHSYTYRYKSFYEIPENLPSSLQERYRLPSDHYPLVLTFRMDS